MNSPKNWMKDCSSTKNLVIAAVLTVLLYFGWKMAKQALNEHNSSKTVGYPNETNFPNDYYNPLDDHLQERADQPLRNNFPRRNIRRKPKNYFNEYPNSTY